MAPASKSFIGLSVSVQLQNGSKIAGTITHIDAHRNTLQVKSDSNGKVLTLDRAKIASLSTKEPTTTAATNAITNASRTPASSTSTSTSTSAAGTTSQQREGPPEIHHLPTPPNPSKRDRRKRNEKHGYAFGGHNDGSETAAMPLEDFDFEASAKSFDKARIWSEIRAHDQSDPAALLVAHNRIPGPQAAAVSAIATGSASGSGSGSSADGKGKMRKLRNDENVLSPEPEDDERPEEDARVLPARTPVKMTPSTTQDSIPNPTNSAFAALERENTVLKRRLFILQALAGLSVTPQDSAPDSQGTTLSFDCAIQSAPVPTTFVIESSMDETDAKIRFKPSTAALPDKYNREMGLRLDNGSARVFLQRLVAAQVGAANGQE